MDLTIGCTSRVSYQTSRDGGTSLRKATSTLSRGSLARGNTSYVSHSMEKIDGTKTSLHPWARQRKAEGDKQLRRVRGRHTGALTPTTGPSSTYDLK